MRYVEELKYLLKARFPEFAKLVNDQSEATFINNVAVAFKVEPQANPTDFAMTIIGLIGDGKTPGDGAGTGSGQEKDSKPRAANR